MQPLIGKDFLLSTNAARELYHEHAEKMPIVDYHCHIDPRQIAEDMRYENLAKAWLGEDHYKWRIMRANGVDERFITGDAPDYEKFEAWAAVVPKLIGNPLYLWTHLELLRGFGIEETLSPKTCKQIWVKANETLKTLTARRILEQFHVKALCTTDDPADDLHWHKLIREDESYKTLVLPAFRPDQALGINKPGFAEYVLRLEHAAGMRIRSLSDMEEALSQRLQFFAQMGCLTADHEPDAITPLRDRPRANTALCAALSGQSADAEGTAAYQTELLLFLARLYKKYGFVMQLRLGVVRDVNPVMLQKLGPGRGFDAMAGHAEIGAELCALFGMLEAENALPKAIVYSLNPADNAQITSVIGCFQGAGIANKIQHGSAWWLNDTKHGMEAQLTNLAESSVLANFVGMLTDSRSFLSYTRHEYFRRILCELLGKWVENGEYPRDMETLGSMVRDISCNNAVRYFGFHVN